MSFLSRLLGKADPAKELLAAATAGDLERLRAALAAGASTTATHDDGLTALAAALVGGHDDVAVALIEAGAEPNRLSAGEFPPLLLAASDHTLKALAKLLDKSVAVDTRGPSQRTALMEAAENGEPRAVRALLAAGAKIDLQDELGFTALILACSSYAANASATGDFAATVRTLLEAGANVELTTTEGLTALAVAEQQYNEDLVRLLSARK